MLGVLLLVIALAFTEYMIATCCEGASKIVPISSCGSCSCKREMTQSTSNICFAFGVLGVWALG